MNGENAWANLSEREQEFLKMVALGHTSAEIAEQLSLSMKNGRDLSSAVWKS